MFIYLFIYLWFTIERRQKYRGLSWQSWVHHYSMDREYAIQYKNKVLETQQIIKLTEMKELIKICLSRSCLKQHALEKSSGCGLRLFQGNITLFEKKNFGTCSPHLQFITQFLAYKMFLSDIWCCIVQGNEKVIYEFVVRHFLACCSKDAQGQETTVEIDVNNEVVNISLNAVKLYQLQIQVLRVVHKVLLPALRTCPGFMFE